MLRIRLYGDDVLRQKAQPVTTFDQTLENLVDDMVDTMLEADGIGLAAPQVGLSQALIIVDTAPDDEEADPIVLVNPSIIETSDDTCDFEEGCLSMPGVYATVERPAAVTVRYQDLDGEWVEEAVDGFLARIVLHEVDHLNGVLFTDYLTPQERESALQGLILSGGDDPA